MPVIVFLNNSRVFSNRLKDLMLTEKVSKRALSNRTGLERKSIQTWLNAKHYPRYDALLKLLKEIVLNVVINKSILSSLFHAVERLNKYCGLSNELYEQGLMSDTPDYLEDFETEQLKKLQR